MVSKMEKEQLLHQMESVDNENGVIDRELDSYQMMTIMIDNRSLLNLIINNK